MYEHTNAHLSIRDHERACTHVRTYARACARTCAYVLKRMYLRVCARERMCANVYAHTTCACVSAHKCMRMLTPCAYARAREGMRASTRPAHVRREHAATHVCAARASCALLPYQSIFTYRLQKNQPTAPKYRSTEMHKCSKTHRRHPSTEVPKSSSAEVMFCRDYIPRNITMKTYT